ncbi:hypothetical protein [Parapedobacter sp. DT-150]|uniref:hypothetical protein n=1 Tax=Parapedobacter sp. DT-150 TaxID=3396162 RepID=UPI003F1E0994
MRYLLLFAFLCFGVHQLSAQVTKIDTVKYPTPVIPKRAQYNFNTDFWYTVAIRAYAHEQFPQVLNQPAGGPFQNSYLNGILFKINDNQVGYRLQAAHFNNEITFDNECDGCLPKVTGKFRNTALKVGVEKSVNYARFQPYFGADVGFMIQELNTKGYGNTTIFAEDHKNAGLFSPFIGAKLYIVPRVAVAAEANFNIAYTYQKINNYSDDSFTGAPVQTKRYRWEYFFSPVAALTLQYSFGLINQ